MPPNFLLCDDRIARRRGHVSKTAEHLAVRNVVLIKPHADPWAIVQTGLQRRGFAVTNEKGAGHDG